YRDHARPRRCACNGRGAAARREDHCGRLQRRLLLSVCRDTVHPRALRERRDARQELRRAEFGNGDVTTWRCGRSLAAAGWTAGGRRILKRRQAWSVYGRPLPRLTPAFLRARAGALSAPSHMLGPAWHIERKTGPTAPLTHPPLWWLHEG